MNSHIVVGDCREVLAEQEPNIFDAVVTDPPYGTAFMGKSWDITGIAFDPEMWRAIRRVLKPGGYLLAMGGTRTSHRMVCAIEDAEFEIRDTLSWLYGSGFPKSLNVSKAIDKADPTTDAAREWDGWHTALKPAHEPICMARKPLAEKTVAANVLAHGVGAINVDACRVGSESTRIPRPAGSLGRMNDDGWQPKPGFNGSDKGRWPPNVAMDEDAARLLGASSRFMYVAKASRAERNRGLDGMPERSNAERDGRQHFKNGVDIGGSGKPINGTGKSLPIPNHHPTVKPVALMRWLVRMVTPPGGIILDPFMGSGSTGVAATLEGFNFVGIEQDAEYAEIARRRIDYVKGSQ